MLVTVGHGTLSQDGLVALLRAAGVTRLVDVRTAPGSRRSPHLHRDELARWLPEAGITYRWERALGGFRRPLPDSPNTGLRNESFRGYADHTRTPEFAAALAGVLAEAAGQQVAVMCSEAVWWRCHRRIVADAAVLLHREEVRHLMHDGRLVPHHPTDGAEATADGLRYR